MKDVDIVTGIFLDAGDYFSCPNCKTIVIKAREVIYYSTTILLGVQKSDKTGNDIIHHTNTPNYNLATYYDSISSCTYCRMKLDFHDTSCITVANPKISKSIAARSIIPKRKLVIRKRQ